VVLGTKPIVGQLLMVLGKFCIFLECLNGLCDNKMSSLLQILAIREKVKLHSKLIYTRETQLHAKLIHTHDVSVGNCIP
jgi:hypothetical protein